MLQHEEYDQHIDADGVDDPCLSFGDWCTKSFTEKLHFQYWYLPRTLAEFALWYNALDMVNYARWLPVHISDLVNLIFKVPDVATEFRVGKWVVYKSQKALSGIAIDQTHEQSNDQVKESGAAVGLAENPSEFQSWMAAGPEEAWILCEFEENFNLLHCKTDLHHYEQMPATQNAFSEEVKSLVSTNNDMEQSQICWYLIAKRSCLILWYIQ